MTNWNDKSTPEENIYVLDLILATYFEILVRFEDIPLYSLVFSCDWTVLFSFYRTVDLYTQ